MSTTFQETTENLRFSEDRLEINYLGSANLPTATDDGKDIIRGLTQTPKSLPPRYFYDEKGSQLFEQICELPEYYPTRTEAEILQQYAVDVAQLTGACELVELGSGSSTKTRLLLDAYESQGYPLRYVPIDVSGEILEESAKQLLLDYPKLKVQGQVGTYEHALSQLTPTPLPSRMVFFLGSSLGNFAPQQCDRFFEKMIGLLAPGDYFLLGIDLQKPKQILEAAYNDTQGVTAAFNLNMLAHLNWRFQGNFDLDRFTHQAIYNQSESQIEMYLHCQQTHVVRLASLDLTVEFQAGESILTEISRKFNLEQMQHYLKGRGLNTVQAWTDTKQWFGLLLCQIQGV
ncbi:MULTISPECIES: L-histidine N(alpha)-methyltransferase [unclassified Moorena]|uniref:L-histidine N(alpha)-methyltransferase n=1 Tax=unclassified Moorena TaxID=2683338 RepID=UPI0013FF9F57|nr:MULTISPECIES: L-histidine N(alpha)-methyltransferase [unclassified Moorena]NEO14008.1 L-histidine N(alpha)-methyltransferase [Moorena sp. SIO3E8]NEQ00433.1 L-histidine N(alpha)-methyltransferase [Moorena sp. SIO3F7]